MQHHAGGHCLWSSHAFMAWQRSGVENEFKSKTSNGMSAEGSS